MLRSRTAGFVLVAFLVFAQALAAHHDLLHEKTPQSNCQICLQASSGTAALCTDIAVAPIPIFSPASLGAQSTFSPGAAYPPSPPGRAPPTVPL